MKIIGLKTKEPGFTIVELMIALSVLSVVLLISSATLIQLGKIFNKGVNAANVQNTTRNIISEMSGALEFGGTTPFPCSAQTHTTTSFVDSGGASLNTASTCAAGYHAFARSGHSALDVYSFCIDTTRYSYVLDKQVAPFAGEYQTYHALWRDTMSTNANCNPLDLTNPGTPTDADTSPTSQGTELIPQHMSLTRFYINENTVGSGIYTVRAAVAFGDFDLMLINTADGTVRCSGDAGQEFCATSGLDTVATRRLK